MHKLKLKHDLLALVAQLVEHFLGKEEVTGSIPVEGSMKLFLSRRINDVEGQI
jgi:hypothetical protein